MVKKVIKDRTVIAFPPEKWAVLKEFVQQYGTKQNIVQQTGISATTLDNVLKSGKGQIRTLIKISDFLAAAKKEEESLFK